jgi:hypothetical protein
MLGEPGMGPNVVQEPFVRPGPNPSNGGVNGSWRGSCTYLQQIPFIALGALISAQSTTTNASKIKYLLIKEVLLRVPHSSLPHRRIHPKLQLLFAQGFSFIKIGISNAAF